MEDKKETYLCPKCQYKSTANRYLINHMQSAHSHIVLKCSQCSFVSKSKLSLYNHVRFYHKEKVQKCKTCEYFCLNTNDLKKHSQIYHEGLRYKCRYCLERFPTKGKKRKHQNNVHNPKPEDGEIIDEGKVPEEEYGEIIEEEEGLIKFSVPITSFVNIPNISTILIENAGDLEICAGKEPQNVNESKKVLVETKKANTKEVDRKVTCLQSSSNKISNEESLVDEKLIDNTNKAVTSNNSEIHTIEKVENEIVADNIKQPFVTTPPLKAAHKISNAKRLDEQIILCKIPDTKDSNRMLDAKEHEINNAKQSDDYISQMMTKVTNGWHCIKCEKTNSNKRHMQDHIEYKHMGGGGHPCKKCDKTFENSNYLYNHIRQVHNQLPVFVENNIEY